ncbi:hypothetical protein GGR89_004398, partial [Sphingomonas trueperi]|nr:hypothetical protein [Sphingomonas trueperi]
SAPLRYASRPGWHHRRASTNYATGPVVAGSPVELPLGLPDRAFHALRHKERYRTRAADALTDLIKEQVA